VGGGQYDWGGAARLQGLFPTQGTQAPFVAGLEARKVILRPWRDEVIASAFRKIKKFLRNNGTYHMPALVALVGSAKPISVKACARTEATSFQISSENIFHGLF
jgi:hypothetical protein